MRGADAIVSAVAIHNLEDARERELHSEIRELLAPGGVLANLEHVASPTPSLHSGFVSALGLAAGQEDASNRLLDAETQLGWLREVGFSGVDCLALTRRRARAMFAPSGRFTGRHRRATAP